MNNCQCNNQQSYLNGRYHYPFCNTVGNQSTILKYDKNYNSSVRAESQDKYENTSETAKSNKKKKETNWGVFGQIALAILAGVAIYKGHGAISRGVDKVKADNAAFRATHKNFSLKGVGNCLKTIGSSIIGIFKKTS